MIEYGVSRYANFISRTSNVANSSAYTSTNKMHEFPGKKSINGVGDHLGNNVREMLMWHCQGGHRNMKYIQQLAQFNILTKQLLRVKNIPICPDCKLGDQYRKTANGRGTIDNEKS